MGQQTHWIAHHDSGVSEDLVKLGSRVSSPARGEVGISAHEDWIESAEEPVNRAALSAQLIRSGHLQQINRLRRHTFVQSKCSTKYRQITEPDGRVLRKADLQIACERLRLGSFTGEGERKSRSVFDLAVIGDFKRCRRVPLRQRRLSVECLPDRFTTLE